jgi:PAS domain S-box-containing protein
MKSERQGDGVGIQDMTTDQATPEMRENGAQFRELMSHLEQVFWIKNSADDEVRYISPAYATVYGRSCQSLYDNFQTFVDSIHPEDRERMVAVMAGQRETGGYTEEYRIVRPDGETRWISARSYPVRDEEGKVLRFAGIAEDITERKSLELDRARLAAIVEYSEDAIIGMSVDCFIVSWNRGAERQYGYTAEEIIGCSLSVLFPLDHYQEYLRTLRSVRQGKPVASCDTVRRRKDGTLINTSVNIFPIAIRDRVIVGASKIGRDVSAIKELEARFIEAQKMDVMGKLAAGIAHDFNNLLSVVLSCCHLMMAKPTAGTSMRQHVETIRQAAKRAAGLTHQLLLFSRRDSPTAVVLDVGEVVNGLDPMLRQLVDEEIDLVIVNGPRVGRVKADSGYLGQMLLNLVVYARDAMPGGGKLSVTTRNVVLDQDYARSHAGVTPGNYVELTVGDTGSGIAAEARSHLFEPFFTTKPRGKGTGLGLATCDTIVKQCGGHISVYSEVGKGTTFKVYLPAVDEPLQASVHSPDTQEPMPVGTETLLVVERERAVRDLACSVLTSLGYGVLRATNAQEALRVARDNGGDAVRLVIADVRLPLGTAEWLDAVCPDLKCLFTFGPTDEAILPQGMAAATTAYLPKPYTVALLAHKVRALLDQ